MRGKGSKADNEGLCDLRKMMLDFQPSPIDLTAVKSTNISNKKIFLLSKFLGVNPGEICLVSRSVRLRKTIKTPVYNMVFKYNNDFVEILKQTQEASFSRSEKLWSIPQDTFLEHVQEDFFGHTFSVIVDIDDGHLIQMEARSGTPPKMTPYALLPSPITIHLSDILDAMNEVRPGDEYLENGLRIFNGSELVKVCDERFSTRHPFVFARASVTHGQPRYAIVSTLTGTLEALIFAPKSSMALAKFHDACQGLNEPVILASTSSRAQSFSLVTRQIIELLQPGISALKALEKHIPDLKCNLIPLEYTEIFVGDGVKENIEAKVRVNRRDMTEDLAIVTGQTGFRDVIIPISKLPIRTKHETMLTIIHEITHHLRFETPDITSENSHDLKFGIMFCVLCFACQKFTADDISFELSRYLTKAEISAALATAYDVISACANDQQLTCDSIKHAFSCVMSAQNTD